MSAKVVAIRPNQKPSTPEAVRAAGRAQERAAIVRWLLTNGHHDIARQIWEGEHT